VIETKHDIYAGTVIYKTRESIRAKLRRIEQLEARERRLERLLVFGSCRADERAAVSATLARLRETLDHLRDQVAEAEDFGVKVWRPSDFADGDFALLGDGWSEVISVNKKTLTISGLSRRLSTPRVSAAVGAMEPGHARHRRIPYHRVYDRISAEDARQRFPDVSP